MLLAIDVGNTNIVLGLFDGDRLAHSWRVQTLRERTADELGLIATALFAHVGITPTEIGGVIVGSVVPPLTQTVCDMVQRYVGRPAMVVDAVAHAGMPIHCTTPAEVGTDRIVTAVAAHAEYGQVGRPLLVCDFGTATTLDAVDATGAYRGGAICPGVSISADALFQRAARLPRIEVRRPATAIGRSTVEAMESGLFFGYVGMVEGLLRRMDAELGGDSVCVATGGLATVIAPETHLVRHVDVDLTLKGLRLVWQRQARA